MFDPLILAYLLALAIAAWLVSEFFPAPSILNTGHGFGPIGNLFLLICLLTPVAGAFLVPDYLRTSVSPFAEHDWMERVAQLVGPVMVLYIVLRGIVVWVSLALLAGAGWLIFGVIKYVAGK
jgi:hypothetical protein